MLVTTAIATLLALTGFFSLEKSGDGLWRVHDPAGEVSFLLGVDHVRYRGVRVYRGAVPYSHYQRWNDVHYPSIEAWADETAARLREWGFNTLGGGASEEMLSRGFIYCRALSLSHALTVGLGKGWRTGGGREGLWICPHEGSPMTEFPNVYHPDFPAYCDRVAASNCAPYRAERNLFGYFLDNELAWWGRGRKSDGLYEAAMKLPANHTARKAAERIGRKDFLRETAERYFSVVSAAVRRHDPNHLILGTRFAGLDKNDPVVFEIAGKYCDAITFNSYPWADLDRHVVFTKRLGGERVADAFRRVHELSGKPLYVTEWSFPALDTACPCLCGGGQRFRTQRERAQASELFAKTLLALPFVIGYNYFMWVDEPSEGISAAYPEDSNYGLVSEKGVPYAELTGMFAHLHRDLAKWRGGRLPVEREVPEDAVITARRFAAREGAATDEDVRCPRGTRVVSTDEDVRCPRWAITNLAGMAIRGEMGRTDRLVSSVLLNGRELGSVGAMIQHRVGGKRRWTPITMVQSSYPIADGLELIAMGTDPISAGTDPMSAGTDPKPAGTDPMSAGTDPMGVAFEMKFKLLVFANKPSFLLELVDIRNVWGQTPCQWGQTPLQQGQTPEIEALFLSPYAPFARESLPDKPATETKIPRGVWKEPVEAAWRAPDGRVFGARTEAPYLKNFYFYTDAGGQHPDAAFAPVDLPRSLGPGEKYDCRGRVWIEVFGKCL